MGRRYLTLIPYEEAMRLVRTSFPGGERTVTVPVTGSAGQVVAVPVYASFSVPGGSIAAMDGIAVRSRDTTGASDQNPVVIRDYARINTGNLIPEEYDAVIPVEEISEETGSPAVRKPAGQWQWIRPAGEDVREGQVVVARGHRVTPFDIGAFVSYGIEDLTVRTVRVGLVPTGSELVPAGQHAGPGQSIETNTLMADLFLSSMGARCTRYPIVPDDPCLIEEALKRAVAGNDIVVVSAGSSAGTRDFTAGVISTLGELIFHGVAMLPGKPAILGRIDGKAVLGLPGYPRAAQTVIREFGARLLAAWGLPAPLRNTVRVRVAGHLHSDLGFDEFIPVAIGQVNGENWARPHKRGPGVQLSGLRSNGFIHVPAQLEGVENGTRIDAVLTADPGTIRSTILLAGVFDPAIDWLSHLAVDRGYFIRMSDTGNSGAVLALKDSSCHAAPMSIPPLALLPHCSRLAQYFVHPDLTLVQIASMDIGLVAREPVTFADLPRIRFINRQRDASSRMVFDAVLGMWGMEPSEINGYGHEVKSHRGVTDAIMHGTADAGICTGSEARRCGLSFSPIAREQYVLAVRNELLNDPKVSCILDIVRSPDFARFLTDAGGYDTSSTGTVRTSPAPEPEKPGYRYISNA